MVYESKHEDMEIKVYTNDNCRYCKGVITFLENNNIPYQELNTSHDNDAREYIIEKGYKTIPVTEIEGQEDIIGYDLSRLNELIV